MNSSMDDMVVIVRKGFDPLAQRLGLWGPTVVLKNTYFQLGYFGDTTGLEVLVEFDHFFVLAMPFRVTKQRALPNAFVGADGHAQQMYLQEALEKLGIPHEPESVELKRLGGDYRNCEAMTAVLVSLVERTWTAIQQGTDRLFPHA
jgi:hypothetical protein